MSPLNTSLLLAAVALPSTAQLQVVPPGYEVQELALVPGRPVSLALAPADSPYGAGNLYVGVRASQYCAEEDGIYVVPPTGAVSEFATLEPGASPISLQFPPDSSPFGTDLYLVANNSDYDPCDGLDCGGTIQVVDTSGAWIDLTPRTGGPSTPPCTSVAPLTEPVVLAFGNGGEYGLDAYVSNSTNPPGSLMRLAPGSSFPSVEIESGMGLSPAGLSFGGGGAFGTELYLGNFLSNVISIYSSGNVTAFASVPLGPDRLGTLAFGSGIFGEELFVTALSGAQSILTVDASGASDVFATGLAATGFDSLEFGPQGQRLYVADAGTGIIYLIRRRQDVSPDRLR